MSMRSSYRVLPLNIQDVSKVEVASTLRFRTYLVIELLLCILFLLFGMFIPSLAPNFQTIRPTPFQVLSSGDVVLDFRLNAAAVHDATISSKTLLITCLLMPLVVLVAVASMAPRYFPNCTYDVHAIVCVLCTAIGMSEFITNFLKKYVGRLRPNFYSLCEFSIEALKCMADEETINEGRKSFPSGHSSFSFSSMGVAVFFFLGRINKVMEQGTIDVTTMASYNRRKLFMVLSYSPWLYSAFVACSRLVDNWHHASDVIAGMLIGIFTSYVSYHLWYPPISSPYSGVPIISRVGR